MAITQDKKWKITVAKMHMFYNTNIFGTRANVSLALLLFIS